MINQTTRPSPNESESRAITGHPRNRMIRALAILALAELVFLACVAFLAGSRAGCL